MTSAQPGILQPVPRVARYLFLSVAPGASRDALREAMRKLADVADGDGALAAVGPSLVAALGASVPGLHEFPDMSGHGVAVPSTPTALWVWLRGTDRGDLLHLTRRIEKAASPALHLDRVIEGFRHGQGPNGHGRDLTGYEDGTENPDGEAAGEAALVKEGTAAMHDSSFVAVQQWVHDFDAFEALAEEEQDHAFGRRRKDNFELEDSPTYSHVKRTAQESFEPPAFMVRRSMPWVASTKAGLMFVAFGHSHSAFERQMRRMAGQEDGVTDGMFRISKPVTGAYFWCPPVSNGRLDLSQLGL
jgi:putative iron-dependent peroxidase